MTDAFQSFPTHAFGPAWLLWFAKESDQDLELDAGLDDFDDGHHKPPSRRPLLIILLLLLVATAGYIAMNPELLSSIKGMIAAPGSQTAEEQAFNQGPESRLTPNQTRTDFLSPAFREGELVSVVPNAGDLSPVTLSRDAQGTEPGPKVRAGEILTIIDGAFLNQSWVYLVNTDSGAKGWIKEHHIQPHM